MPNFIQRDLRLVVNSSLSKSGLGDADQTRPMSRTVTQTMLDYGHVNLRGGRPSKGQRMLLDTRVLAPLSDAARNRADELGMTMNDYLVTLIAQDINRPQFAPLRREQNNVEARIPAA